MGIDLNKKKTKKPKKLWGLLFFKTITPNYKNVDDKKNAKGENIKENYEKEWTMKKNDNNSNNNNNNNNKIINRANLDFYCSPQRLCREWKLFQKVDRRRYWITLNQFNPNFFKKMP